MIVEGRYLHKKFWLTYNLGQGKWNNRHAARRDVGRSPLLFFENWKKVLWFWKKMPRLYPSLGYVFHSKCSFQKKLQNFSLRCLFLLLVWWSAHQSAPIPWNLLCPAKFLVACLNKEEYRGKRSLRYKEKYTRKYTDKEFQKKEEIKIQYIQKRKYFCLQELEGEASRKIYILEGLGTSENVSSEQIRERKEISEFDELQSIIDTAKKLTSSTVNEIYGRKKKKTKNKKRKNWKNVNLTFREEWKNEGEQR